MRTPYIVRSKNQVVCFNPLKISSDPRGIYSYFVLYLFEIEKKADLPTHWLEQVICSFRSPQRHVNKYFICIVTQLLLEATFYRSCNVSAILVQ